MCLFTQYLISFVFKPLLNSHESRHSFCALQKPLLKYTTIINNREEQQIDRHMKLTNYYTHNRNNVDLMARAYMSRELTCVLRGME